MQVLDINVINKMVIGSFFLIGMLTGGLISAIIVELTKKGIDDRRE